MVKCNYRHSPTNHGACSHVPSLYPSLLVLSELNFLPSAELNELSIVDNDLIVGSLMTRGRY